MATWGEAFAEFPPNQLVAHINVICRFNLSFNPSGRRSLRNVFVPRDPLALKLPFSPHFTGAAEGNIPTDMIITKNNDTKGSEFTADIIPGLSPIISF
jgi:hypothetical protein